MAAAAAAAVAAAAETGGPATVLVCGTFQGCGAGLVAAAAVAMAEAAKALSRLCNCLG